VPTSAIGMFLMSSTELPFSLRTFSWTSLPWENCPLSAARYFSACATSSAGTGYGIITTIPLGSKVTVQQSCPSSTYWYNVKYGASTGWAHGDWLKNMRSVAVSGGPVLSHVQSYANAVCSATGACSISTYEGHHPTRDRALDTLVSSAYGYYPSDGNYLGDRVAQMTLNQWSSYRIWYVIWKQRINYNDGAGWQWMEDRGSITQNHYDHVHTSFWQ
jgi:hypothetical protein